VAVLLASTVAMLLAPQAAAGQKKTVLVFSRTKGFRHGDAIKKGNPILKQIAEGLGYKCVVSEEPAVFDPDQAKQWDLIIFNNCTGRMCFTGEERLKAFMAQIKGGAGFMGFHAAADCFYDWPEYGKMLNGYFAGHPWSQKVRTRVEEPDHPLMKPFGGKAFEIADEIYQYRNYKRSNARVLMSIDLRSVDPSRGGRKDRDYAMCWIRPWGKGRVFYQAHGHGGNVFENKAFQEHLKLAMQWAIGDLEADTTPSKEIDRAALAAKAFETLRSARTDEQRIGALETLSWCPRKDALPMVVALFEHNQKVAAVAADAAQAICEAAKDIPAKQRIDALKKALPLATSRNVRRSIRRQLHGLGVTDLPISVPPGFIAHWWIAGPIPKGKKNLFETDCGPESGVDLDKGFTYEGKTYKWKKTLTDDDGIVNLNEALARKGNVVGYMYAEVTVEKETPVELRLGSDDGFVLWLNGQRLGGRNVSRAIRPGSDKFKAALKAGGNQVLMKVLQGGGDWAGCLQIVGPKGGKVAFTTRKK